MEKKGKKKPLRITESKTNKQTNIIIIIVLIDHLNSIPTSVKGT